MEDLQQLCPIFEEYGVDLVAGGAGAMPEWLLPKREWYTSSSWSICANKTKVRWLHTEIMGCDINRGRPLHTLQRSVKCWFH